MEIPCIRACIRELQRNTNRPDGNLPHGLESVCENASFAPAGLDYFALVPTAYAVGCILSPLRGWKPLALFHPESAKRDLSHALKPNLSALDGATEAAPFQRRP